MTNVIIFELCGGAYALKLDSLERILAPGDPAPSGCRVVDLARLFDLSPPSSSHLAVLAGGGRALAIGRPVGAARIEAAWILPLPGYMFRGGRAPFRGLIDMPPGRTGGMSAARHLPAALLLDEETIAEMPA